MDELSYVTLPPDLPTFEARTRELKFGMASEPKVGALLRALAATKPRGRFLELGTGTGVSTAWLLDGMDIHSKLISVDTDKRFQEVAGDVLGMDARLTLVVEDGLTFLRRQPAESFDLVFADAMPGKFNGLEEALSVVKLGGFYVIDDLLPQENWPADHAPKVPALIQDLAEHPNFEVLPLAWASGVLVAVRKFSEKVS
jgi:predicted O-methyltransferase YrrM